MKRFEKTGRAYVFLLRGLIRNMPRGKRDNFRSELVKKLRNYKFEERGKKDPPHPNSFRLLGDEDFLPEDVTNPQDVFEATIIQINPYYVAKTQNRIKKYIEENL